ncbi:pyruvoyl-dependent arginine decarboxylase, partial [Candidatus Woesearchaeota archaeon]|nr:pyruvoyl-dependent arginine decarboxylase [Candidatus Woesearchaeota archaeon]
LGNLIPYTSILPRIAKEIPLEEGISRVEHGAEMKVIQAAAHVDKEKGEKRATAAILYGWLHPRKRGAQHVGGLVCEYNGPGTIREARDNLTKCLDDLYQKPNRAGFAFSERYDLRKAPILAATIEPKERFGTALAALAFVRYFMPVLGQNITPPEDAFALAQGMFSEKGL